MTEANKVNKGKKARQPKNMMLIIGIPILMCICGPYIYYAVMMNAWGHVNKPAGYHMPSYFELWKVVAGGLIFQMFRQLFYWALYPTFFNLAKEQNDEELRVKYTRKACD